MLCCGSVVWVRSLTANRYSNVRQAQPVCASRPFRSNLRRANTLSLLLLWSWVRYWRAVVLLHSMRGLSKFNGNEGSPALRHRPPLKPKLRNSYKCLTAVCVCSCHFHLLGWAAVYRFTFRYEVGPAPAWSHRRNVAQEFFYENAA